MKLILSEHFCMKQTWYLEFIALTHTAYQLRALDLVGSLVYFLNLNTVYSYD